MFLVFVFSCLFLLYMLIAAYKKAKGNLQDGRKVYKPPSWEKTSEFIITQNSLMKRELSEN